MNTAKAAVTEPVIVPIPPLPGGGSWRFVDNQWISAEARPAQEPAVAPQPTEE